jgi:cytochrome c553
MIRSLNRTVVLTVLLTGAAAVAVSLAVQAQDTAQKAQAAAKAASDAAPAATAAPVATAKPAAPAAGSAERGKSLAYTCQGCHGITGYKNAYPTYSVPRILGQSPEYLTASLKAYKDGSRKHSTMQAQAQSFSDQDIADISAYLSSLNKK